MENPLENLQNVPGDSAKPDQEKKEAVPLIGMLDEEDREAVKKYLGYFSREDTRDIQEKSKLLRELIEKGESMLPERRKLIDDDLMNGNIYGEDMQRALLEEMERVLKEEKQTDESLIESVLKDVNERTLNDYISYFDNPKLLKKDDPDLFESMDKKYRNLTDEQRRAVESRLRKTY